MTYLQNRTKTAKKVTAMMYSTDFVAIMYSCNVCTGSLLSAQYLNAPQGTSDACREQASG